MKGQSNFGYKFLLFIALIVAIANAAARGHKDPFKFDPDPDDSQKTTKARDSARNLRFPIHDKTGDPMQDNTYHSMDLADPPNISQNVEYNPADSNYYYDNKIGGDFIRNPSYMTMDEYLKYKAQQDEQSYWKRRLDALTIFNKKPELPQMYREGLFDRIFGGNSIQVRPQGNIDITFGGNWQNIKNPTLVQRAQKYGVFDFDMQMNINLLATVGDKLKLNISNNTKATFDYQNVQKLEYTGKEDEIIKKIEAGNVSFPLKSNLISGVQSLFGLKTQLQFGRLWVTGVVSQQKSKRQSLTVQGGSQTQQFAIKADEYEENKHYLLSQYFYNNYNNALKSYPIINSQVNVNKIEVWITNRTGAVDNVRDVLAFTDLGESKPYLVQLTDPTKPAFPDNRTNLLYDQLMQNPNNRIQGAAATLQGLTPQQDYERTTARKLNPSEFSFNPQLGYISLNTQLNPDDILAVAFRYTTTTGKVYQVGEFAEDIPPAGNTQKVLFLKLLKGISARPSFPIWHLMMKNIYTLGGLGVSKEDFRLNVLYQDPGGGEKRYLPEGPNAGIPLLTLLNLDRLNFQNDPQPDGIFDFVDGITINTQQGKIIFPVLEPFGEDLRPALGNNPQLERKYLYTILYDSTKTIARQFQQTNRYVIKGSYKSASSSEIFLGGFNIPQGSVSVSAGGQKLIENQDYQIDYGLGKIKILNSGILNSGIPINVQYEDNATFGFQQQNFLGTRFDYYANKKLAIGGTFMRLTERPFTQKTTFGEDPIKNTVLGLDANYQSEFPGLSRALDKLPVYSTTAPSFINASGEVASLLPGHPKQIDALDPEGSVYIDDFEGTASAYDLKFPANAWSLASTPFGAHDKFGNVLFPEAGDGNKLSYGYNRAKLAWYFIEPTLVDPGGGVPDYVKNDPNQHYIRMVQTQDIFPQKNTTTLQNATSTLDLGFYPKDKGPYNFDYTNVDADDKLLNPERRWGGIMRPIEYSDFEASNVQFIEFWVMDPFINNPNAPGGSLYINLGNVSEDVLKDSRKFFENGIPYPSNPDQLDKTVWGNVPKFQQQITRAFDNDPAARAVQDVGYDGANDDDENGLFGDYLGKLAVKVNAAALAAAHADPSNDNYKYYRDASYDDNGTGVLGRYKNYNNPQGNSPVTDPNSSFATSATTLPESEDINKDNTLNESESYYEYRLDLKPNMQEGTNYIVNKVVAKPKLPNGNYEEETWYQFKIPVNEYQQRVGDISDFRAIRFIRMYMTGFRDSAIARFAQLQLGRNQWRTYQFSLQAPGENIPEPDIKSNNFSVTTVSVEENSGREPIPYVIPPGVNRQQAAVATGQNVQLNEQALSLQTCALKDGDARGVYKEIGVDMRQFSGLRMFMHAESQVGQVPLRDGDVKAFIRIGSDFTNNYYEYQIPLKITNPGTTDAEGIWPEANRMDMLLDDLVKAKTERNTRGFAAYVPYSTTDSKGNTIIVVGNPNIGDAKTIMLGILNPKKSTTTPTDDGLPKCTEVWFNELRMIGLNEKAGYAAAGKVNVQLADLGNVNLSGSMHTEGYGNIDQKVDQRFKDNFYQYNASTNLNMGKMLPRKWGVQLPLFLGYSQNVSNPEFNPYDLDVKYSDALNSAVNKAQRDSFKKAAQDYTSITSVNLTNIRVLGDPDKQNAKVKPWSVKNFDLSYAYNRQFKRNPTIESDNLVNNKLGLGYTYSIKAKSIEPFKRAIRSKSKWFSLIRDFNFNPLPSNFTFRTDLNKIMDETQVRNISDGPYDIPPTYYKNFTWNRLYTLRWELTRSLSFDFSATNLSRIDEPYGKANTAEKRDTLWTNIKKLGRNTNYTQTFNTSYNVPLQKIPVMDWTNLRLSYSANYTWTAASQLAHDLGNTLSNTQTKQVTGELNFTSLYNKNRYLRAINQPVRNGNKKDSKPKNTGTGNKDVKDLRTGDKKQAPGNVMAGRDSDDDNVKPTPLTGEKDNKKAKPKEEDKIEAALLAAKAAHMSDHQLDSLRRVLEDQEAARKKAEKAKAKAARKAARKARRNVSPEISPGVRIVGRLLTMLKRTTVNYSENAGTILPGYLDSTRLMGVNTSTGAPGFDFVYGYQPSRQWVESQGSSNRLSTDSLFNAQLQQTYSQNLNLQTTLEPFQDFRIDLSLTKTFSKAHSELYKDTLLDPNATDFQHLNPYETGSFNISYIGLKTMFKSSGANSTVYNQFLANREIISSRLGNSNPYTNGVNDPNNPNYKKGYTQYSQDVLIPAFIAAYSGKSANDVALIDYKGSGMRYNPFKNYYPMPNWRVTYNGLSKLAFFKEIMNSFVVNHSYTGTMSMNSFNTSLLYADLYGLGAPSFIDSSSGNYIPFYQVPNLTISEQLSPLLGFEMSFRNNVTASIRFNRTRTIALNLLDYQVSETKSSEYVIGGGYRVKGLRLPFAVLGVRKLKNDLTFKVDVGIREDRTTNNYLSQNIGITTRGQKVITISPTIDYIINDKLTLRMFYDRRQSIPYVSSSYPITTTRAGLMLRFTFAQ